jgi:hypothetical protein
MILFKKRAVCEGIMNKFIYRLKAFLKGNIALRDAVRKASVIFWKHTRRKTIAHIKKRYGDIIEKYNSSVDSIDTHNEEDSAKTIRGGAGYQVWVCWLQGEENMPALVKMCYATLLKNADGHKINLITFDNYREFTDIPDYIIEKHKKNIIHNIQLSDIIRVFLLSKHGGLWIDATYYVSGKLPTFDGLSFWTPKWNGGREQHPSGLYLESLLYCRYPNNVLTCFLRDIFVNYWKNENKLIDYLLLSASIECAYNNIKQVKDLIDAIPLAKRGFYDLYYSTHLEYDENEYKSLCGEIQFHKLTYKEIFKEYTKGEKLTFYGHLWQEYKRGESESV